MNRFITVLDDRSMLVCTVKDIETAKTTIEARRLRAKGPWLYHFAINSNNSLLCAAGAGGKGVILVDLESGEEVLKFADTLQFAALQFAPDNPYTLFTYELWRGCSKVGPARLRRAHQTLHRSALI